MAESIEQLAQSKSELADSNKKLIDFENNLADSKKEIDVLRGRLESNYARGLELEEGIEGLQTEKAE